MGKQAGLGWVACLGLCLKVMRRKVSEQWAHDPMWTVGDSGALEKSRSRKTPPRNGGR